MKEFKTVNGVKFEIKKAIENPRMSIRKRLDTCYEKPSEAKKEIYEWWLRFAISSFDELDNFGIESYNCMMFTLGWNTSKGQYYVTKTRQEFYPYK